ncbi:unnamed protein product [Cunninghamella blakesleeana]
MGVHTYRLLDEGPVVKRRFVQFTIALLTFIIFAGVIAPTYIAYSNSQDLDNKIDDTSVYSETIAINTYGTTPGSLLVNGVNKTMMEASFEIMLGNVDPLKETVSVHVKLLKPDPTNMTSNVIGFPSPDLPQMNDWSIYFNGQLTTLKPYEPDRDWSFSASLFGHLGNYPMDRYSNAFAFQFASNQTFIDGVRTKIKTYGIQTGWVFDMAVTVDNDRGYFTIEPSVSRNSATKGFSLFIVVLSWILSLCQFFLASQSLLRNREMTPQILALPAALLFALPNLRNSQPGVPLAGIVLDMAGFYWNMALVAISLIISFLMFIFQYDVHKID